MYIYMYELGLTIYIQFNSKFYILYEKQIHMNPYILFHMFL